MGIFNKISIINCVMPKLQCYRIITGVLFCNYTYVRVQRLISITLNINPEYVCAYYS